MERSIQSEITIESVGIRQRNGLAGVPDENSIFGIRLAMCSYIIIKIDAIIC